MGRLRRLLRIAKRLGATLLALLASYGAAALILPRIPVNDAARRSSERGATVFVESNGVHADFVLPARACGIDWTARLPAEWFEAVDGTFGWIAIGWGDKGFYLETPTWSDLEFGTAFRAAFFLSSAAMHVTWLRDAPLPGPRCRRLDLTEEQYRALAAYVLGSFALDETGRPRRIDHPGYTAHDRFFDATGTYSFIHTCNEWTGAGLRRIGVRTGLWTPFAADVLRHLGG